MHDIHDTHDRQHDERHDDQQHQQLQSDHDTPHTPPREPDQSRNPSLPGASQVPGSRRGRSGQKGTPHARRHARQGAEIGEAVHLLFGSLEDLLADLEESGPPEGNFVRVERLVRSRSHTMGGTATLGVAVTARREDEILSVWVIVARLALDPWGQPLSLEHARAATARHHDAQHVLAAVVADAGFDVRGGLYLLAEACYGLDASAAVLASGAKTNPPAGADEEHEGDAEEEQHA